MRVSQQSQSFQALERCHLIDRWSWVAAQGLLSFVTCQGWKHGCPRLQSHQVALREELLPKPHFSVSVLGSLHRSHHFWYSEMIWFCSSSYPSSTVIVYHLVRKSRTEPGMISVEEPQMHLQRSTLQASLGALCLLCHGTWTLVSRVVCSIRYRSALEVSRYHCLV